MAVSTKSKPKAAERKPSSGFTFEDYVINSLNQLQADNRRLDDKIEKNTDKLDNRFMWMVGLLPGTFITLAGLILSKHSLL